MDPWCRGREVARGVLRTLLKRAKTSLFCHRREIEIFGRLFSIHERPNVFFSQMPGRHPPHITGRRANTVSLGWVRAPSDRAPFRVHDEVIALVDQCLTRSRMAGQGVRVS